MEEQLLGIARQSDVVDHEGLGVLPSTNNQLDAGCSSLSSAVPLAVASSACSRLSPSDDDIQNTPTSPSPSLSSTSTSRDESEGNTDTERNDEVDAPGSKKETSRLRKGKWTIEEEEYTSRIIQFFSTGFLTLPDGATLRSYLAEKLNCDPMRITKKFTGACCLGRRAYHLRDRPRASQAEIEMARLEIQHLEQRFLLRVEHEQSGLPLPPRHELLPAAQPPAPVVGATVQSSVIPSSSFFPSIQLSGAPTIVPTFPWLQQNPTPTGAAVGSTNYSRPGSQHVTGLDGLNAFPGVNQPTAFQNTPSLPPIVAAAGQMLLQNAVAERMQQPMNNAQLQILNSIVASLALAQAAAKLSEAGMSAIPSLAAATAPAPSMTPSGLNPDHAITGSTPVANPTTGCVGGGMIRPQQGDENIHVGVPHIQPFQNEQQRLVLNQLLKDQHQLSQQRAEQEKKEKEATVPAPSLALEQHAKQLKAAFEEQQHALRLSYEKILHETEERERLSSLMDVGTGSGTSVAPLTTQKAADAGMVADGSMSSLTKATTPAEQLQRSYEAHLASLQKSGEQLPSLPETVVAPQEMPSARNDTKLNLGREEKPLSNESSNSRRGTKIGKRGISTTNNDAPSTKPQSNRKQQDEEAGTILLGFLNSLRESFVDAVEAKDGEDTVNPLIKPTKGGTVDVVVAKPVSTTQSKRNPSKTQEEASRGDVAGMSPTKSKARNGSRRNIKRPRDSSNITKAMTPRQESPSIQAMSRFPSSHQLQRKPTTVTEASSSGTSSQPATEQSSSSLEDSDSKSDKTDQFSSEDSSEEKDQVETENRSKGPPRKRLKSYDNKLNEFTRENLLEHSKRMDMELDSYGGGSGTNRN